MVGGGGGHLFTPLGRLCLSQSYFGLFWNSCDLQKSTNESMPIANASLYFFSKYNSWEAFPR